MIFNFNRSPHTPLALAGESRPLTDAWIIHWDYVWHDRAARQAKAEFYRALETYTGEEFYLYEDQRYDTRPLHASLEILDWPEVLQAGKPEPVLIATRNNSNRWLRPS